MSRPFRRMPSWWEPSPALWASVYVLALLTSIVGTAFTKQVSKRNGLREAEIAATLKDCMSEQNTKAMIDLLRDLHHSK